jgi:hypothetical protein
MLWKTKPTIKVKHANGPAVNLVESAQSRQSQAVVTAKGDDLGLVAHRGNSLVRTKMLEALGHLLASNGIIVRSNGDISAVDDLGPAAIRVDVGARVECAEANLSGGRLADGPGAKPSA